MNPLLDPATLRAMVAPYGLAAGTLLIVFLAWTRWRRMGWPATPSSTAAADTLVDAHADATRRRSEAQQAIALHDSLLRASVRRSGERFDESVARVETAIVRLGLSAESYFAMMTPARAEARRLVPRWIVPASLPFVAAADFALGRAVVEGGIDLLQWEAAAVAVTITSGFLVAGRVIGSGLLHRRAASTSCGVAATLTLAAVVAGFQEASRPQWFLVALVPTFVSCALTVLSHPETLANELALDHERLERRRFERALDDMERALAVASRRAARHCYRACPGVVARPWAVGLGEHTLVPGPDVRTSLAALGLSPRLAVLDDAHALLRQLRRVPGSVGSPATSADGSDTTSTMIRRVA